MIKEQEYLKTKLIEAGIRNTIITSQKMLEKANDLHVGAVIFDKSTFTRNGSKKTYRDQDGAQVQRTKTYDKTSTFKVIIGEYKPEACEDIVDAFLAGLGNGPKINGNHVQIEIVEAVWLDDDDSILKSKLTCEITVNFYGGVYKDSKKTAKQIGNIGFPLV